jgi:uncharacterized protein YbaR (Trm112 family)
MISKDLLAILVCPESRTPLDIADDDVLALVNHAIAAGKVTNKGGAAVTEKISAGLIRRDRAVLYPIIDRIPILLADEGIALGPFTANR